MTIPSPTRLVVALLAVAAITLSAWQIAQPQADLDVQYTQVGTTPVKIYRQPKAPPAPAIVIAHGFAGSRQLMEPFAVTLANAGYVAIAFDYRGHGRNPEPLTGDTATEDGATRTLSDETRAILAFARTAPGTDGRLALLGHSMASDIIVRVAAQEPDVATTIAVSLFSREVTADQPRNLLMIIGGWENFLAEEALKSLRLTHGPDAQVETTYGDAAQGNARRVVLSDSVEHVGVLYSGESLREARDWANLVFDRQDAGAVDTRGPWVCLMILGIVALGWPLAGLIPQRQIPQRQTTPRPNQIGRRIALAMLGPAVLTPLILYPIPTGFLPVLVADYLAVHFAVFGALTFLALAWARGLDAPRPRLTQVLIGITAGAAMIAALALALDSTVTSYVPITNRLDLILALTIGALLMTTADAYLIDAARGRWWAILAGKLCFFGSLVIAIALDLEELFFLIIIAPVMVLFFLVHGLWAHWLYQRTAAPLVPGIACALALGWALGVIFPLLA
ncbi:MAG: alpha/beta fold hydrolase [Pseudomonadota bacterium]